MYVVQIRTYLLLRKTLAYFIYMYVICGMALEYAGTFILTDDSLDRHSERVKPDGVDLLHFKVNPIMLYNHHRSSDWSDGDSKEVMPVGRWNDVMYNAVDNNITGDAYIDTSDEIGQRLFNKVNAGVISAVSIGFRAIDYSDDEENKHVGQRGVTITKSELLEVSIVDIPSNKNALRINKTFNKSISEGERDNLFFFKSYIKSTVEPTKITTTMNFTDKAKSLAKKFLGIDINNVEDFNAAAEGVSFDAVAKSLYAENETQLMAKVGESMKIEFAATVKAFDDKITAQKEAFALELKTSNEANATKFKALSDKLDLSEKANKEKLEEAAKEILNLKGIKTEVNNEGGILTTPTGQKLSFMEQVRAAQTKPKTA